MSKYTPTDAQKAQAEERRARVRALATKIAQMSQDERSALAARIHPLTVEGRSLSVHNVCLLASQYPTVTVVGGFQQWKRAGRMVRKGEKGLAIWIPKLGPVKDAQEPTDARTPSGQSSTGDAEPSELRFIMGTVFDVSQTQEQGA